MNRRESLRVIGIGALLVLVCLPQILGIETLVDQSPSHVLDQIGAHAREAPAFAWGIAFFTFAVTLAQSISTIAPTTITICEETDLENVATSLGVIDRGLNLS